MYDEPEFPQPDETPDDKDLNLLIDDWLAQERPERYSTDDKEWMDEVVEQARRELEQLPAEDIVTDAARRRVYQREGMATKRANKVLRDIDDTGQPPIGWGEGDWRVTLFDVLHLPLSIDRQRVRFGAASAEDLKEWELENHREQEKRDRAQASSRSGARLLAEWMRTQGVQRLEDLRPPGDA